MATVVFDGTRLDDAEALSPGSGNVWLDSGGKAANIEPDFVYQNTNCVSEKVGTTELGIGLDISGGTPSSVDMTTPQVAIFKIIATNSSVLNVKGATGGKLELGSGGLRTNYDQYYVVGGDTYPIKGGWLIIPIDPNGGNQSNRPGTAPTLTAIDYWGWVCDFTGTSKSTNVGMDALDVIPNGSGLTLTGTAGTFADFVSTDEGTATNRWGIVSTQDTVLYVTGVLTIGTATLTAFTASNAVLVFPEAEFLNTVGFFGVDFGLQNASTTIDLTNCVLKSVGTAAGTVDTRPDYTVTGTSGALTITGCTFNVFRSMTLTSGATLTSVILIAGNNLTQAGGTITSCSVSSSTQGDNVAFLTSNNIELVTASTFAFSDGHAIELTSAHTAAGGPYDMSGVIFTGAFGGTPGSNLVASTGSSDAMIYNNSGEALTINIIGGGTVPSVRNAASSTTTIVSGTVTTTVKILDGRDNSNLQNARVILKASDGTGDLDFETSVTITRVTTVATVAHTAHPYVVGNKVEILGANQPEYNGPQTITAVLTNSYDFTVAGSPTTPATGTITSTGIVVEGLTDASGEIADTRSWALAQPVTGVARKGSATPFFVTGNLTGTISTTLGLSITQALTLDE